MYSETVLKFFAQADQRPLVVFDGYARRTNPVCGDEAELWLRLEGDRLVEVSCQVRGCVAAVASLACLSQSVKGVTLKEARGWTQEKLLERLGGLPPNKTHGAGLAILTLKTALKGLEGRL